ncbi:hypothetical protein BDQ17DRAFT_1218267, partial [Cyathus striatus]
LKSHISNLQSSNLLNKAYCNSLRFQLAFKEEKKAAGKGKGKLMGDGMPKLLSGDDFYEHVVEFTKWQK